MTIEAIVIKKAPVREHDQVVTLYTRQLGKTVAVARSILKPGSIQALHLDEGNTIHCELVAGKAMPIITAAQAVRCLSSAKNSAVRWAAAQFFLQVIDVAVYDQQQDEALFVSLAGALTELDTTDDEHVLDIFRQRQGEMLQVMGYGHGGHLTHDERAIRTDADDTYERIAQRRLGSLNVFYELVNLRFS